MPPRGFTYPKFEVLKEPWNEYDLSDGSVLRVKFVLKQLILHGDTSGGIDFQFQTVVALNAPASLWGKPGRSYSLKEVEDAIVERGIGHTPTTIAPSLYIVQSDQPFQLLIDGLVNSASRTNLFNNIGQPVYHVATDARVAVGSFVAPILSTPSRQLSKTQRRKLRRKKARTRKKR